MARAAAPAARRARSAGRAAIAARAERVVSHVDGFISRLPVPENHRELLRVHLDEGRDQLAETPELPAAQLPLLIHQALGGEADPLPLAGACLLVYLGADLLDNLADDELPARWVAAGPTRASLAATTLIAPLPSLALAELEVDPGMRWELARRVASGLLAMSAGQEADIGGRGDDLAEARATAERKSGAEMSLFAAAAADLATDDEAAVEQCSRYGLALGSALQIGSDLADLLASDEPSHDLANGKRTLPVVHALLRLRGADRARLLRLLDEARSSRDPHEEVRSVLERAGSFRYAALVIGVYRHRALGAVAAAGAAGPAADELRAMADDASPLRAAA